MKNFGKQILNPDGSVNRPRLAETAFGSPERGLPSRIEELNRIVHPAVVQRQDRGADEQAGDDLAEHQDLAPHRVREQEVTGPLLVFRHERVRREQDSAEDDQEPRKGRERRDERVRSGGVLDAEGGRQPDEQANDERQEDEHAQEAAAADVLANLVTGDGDDLGERARRHRRSDSWMRSR